MIFAGLKLMIAGMGMVFLFLILMIILISVTSKILAPFSDFLEEKKKVPASQGAETPLDPSLVAAITSAVHQYRKDIINKE